MRRAARWALRIGLGLIALVVVLVGVALIAIHTDFGRERVRRIAQGIVAKTFVGGMTIGKLEGSPFGQLVLRDVVINGPDRKPAFTVATLTVELSLTPLLDHHAHIDHVTIDGLDVALHRDAHGALEIGDLLVPGPPSAWNVELPDVRIHHGHFAMDAAPGGEPITGDALELWAHALIPHDGPLDAELYAAGTWHERAAPIAITAVLRNSDAALTVPIATIAAGDITAEIGNLRLDKGEAATTLGGIVAVHATAAAVAKLVPTLQLPADVTAAIDIAPDGEDTRLAVAALANQSPIRVIARGDLDAGTASAFVSASAIDVGALSGGAVTGIGGIALALTIDASAAAEADAEAAESKAGKPAKGKGKLAKANQGKAVPKVAAAAKTKTGSGSGSEQPVAPVVVDPLPKVGVIGALWGKIDGAPDADVGFSLKLGGQDIWTAIGVTAQGATHAGFSAHIRRDARDPSILALASSDLVASTQDPQRASGGLAPARGSVAASLSASGKLTPSPDLAISGRVRGAELAAFGVAVRTLDLRLAAEHVPAAPAGNLNLDVTDVVRGTMNLRTLHLDAQNLADRRFKVALRTEPLTAPWQVDADAIVGIAVTDGLHLVVDLTHHHVRAAGNSDWVGDDARLTLDPAHLELRGFKSHSARGDIAADATLTRAGRGAGDLTAHAQVHGFDLAALGASYRGKLDTTADVSRRGGAFAGTVAVTGAGIVVDPRAPPIDTSDHFALTGRALRVDAAVTTAGIGTVAVTADVETPADVTSALAWRRLKRTAVRSAELKLEGIDVAGAAKVAKLDGDYHGSVDADYQLSPTSISGALHVRNLHAPVLREAGDVDADLTIEPAEHDELNVALTAKVAAIGAITAGAQIAVPAQWTDPAAWGLSTLRSAQARIANLALDPAVLARLGLELPMRAVVNLAVDVTAGADSAKLTLDVDKVRGGPLAQEVHGRVEAAIARTTSTLAITLASEKGEQLLAIDGTVPLGTAKLLAHPDFRALPLDATIKLPSANAAKLLAILGRDDLVAGTIDGTIKLGGTTGAPTADADLSLTGIRVPPGLGGARLPNLERLDIAGSWDGTTGRVKLTGSEDDGGRLSVVGVGSPAAPNDATLTIQATRFSLAPISVFAPGPAGGAAGVLDCKIDVKGLDPGKAAITGKLHLANARVPIAPVVGTLRQGDVQLEISDRKVTIKVDGKLGAGTVKMTGEASLDAAANGKATITLRKVSPIGQTQPVINADVDAKIGRTDGAWRADLKVSNADVTVPDKKGTPLHEVGAPDDMVFGTDETMAIPKAKVTGPSQATKSNTAPAPATAEPKKVVVEHPLLVAKLDLGRTKIASESNEYKVVAHGNLTATIGVHNTRIDGQVSVDSGDVDLFNHRYLVDHAAVNFDGTADPQLDIRLTHDYPDVTTSTDVTGRLSNPDLHLASDPGTYTQGQLLGFLLGGDPGGDPSDDAREAAAGATSSLIGGKVSGLVDKVSPIHLVDVIKYEPASATNSAAVVVGRWIKQVVFIAARQHIDALPDENTTEGLVQYYLFKRVIIDGTAGDRGYDGIDLVWRHRW